MKYLKERERKPSIDLSVDLSFSWDLLREGKWQEEVSPCGPSHPMQPWGSLHVLACHHHGSLWFLTFPVISMIFEKWLVQFLWLTQTKTGAIQNFPICDISQCRQVDSMLQRCKREPERNDLGDTRLGHAEDSLQ